MNKPMFGQFKLPAQLQIIHEIREYNLRTILPKFQRKNSKYLPELNEYGIQYQPRTTIKAHALANFMARYHAPISRILWMKMNPR